MMKPLYGWRRSLPYPQVQRCFGPYVEDTQGLRYLDLSSQALAISIGHCPERALQRISAQLSSAPYVSTSYGSTPVCEELIAHLDTITRGSYQHTFFANSGSDAVETAVWFARAATNRSAIAHFKFSYHGATHLTRALSGWPDLAPRGRDWHDTIELQAPHCQECPFGVHYSECGTRCVDDAIVRLTEHELPAAVVTEPFITNSGIVPPKEYWVRLFEFCRKNHVLTIADEIATGVFRTGGWLGFNSYGQVPNILLLGKGLTSGLFPFSCVLLDHRSAPAESSEVTHGFTHEAHPLGCAAALGVVEQLTADTDLRANMVCLENVLRSWLQMFVNDCEVAKWFAGKGLWWVLKMSSRCNVDAVVRVLLEHRLLVNAFGDVIQLAPPFCVDPSVLKSALTIVGEHLCGCEVERP